jgi:hypothetical protein
MQIELVDDEVAIVFRNSEVSRTVVPVEYGNGAVLPESVIQNMMTAGKVVQLLTEVSNEHS